MNTPFFKVKAKAPSNIAFIKYWGKKDFQKPINPSLSMSLTHCQTITELFVSLEKDDFYLELFFEEKRDKKFEKRVEKYFLKLSEYYPKLLNYHYKIKTLNTFAHSAGIASSASAFAALASCIEKFLHKIYPEEKIKSPSFLARLGSGSAARSIYGPFMLWGKTEECEDSCDEQAICFDAQKMEKLADTILLVDEKVKKISSSTGHELMNHHPYKDKRIENAHQNIKIAKEAFKKGDFPKLGEVIEREALELHALMLTSEKPYILINEKTLAVIYWVREQRKRKGIEIYFTLDAGPMFT